MKKSIKSFIMQLFKSLKHNFIYIILFEIIYKLIVPLYLKPIIKYAVFMYNSTNQYDNFVGSILFIFLLFFGAMTIYFELSVVCIFIYEGYNKRKISLIKALKRSLMSLLEVPFSSAVIVVLFTFTLLPMAGINMYYTLLPNFNINNFLLDNYTNYRIYSRMPYMFTGILYYSPVFLYFSFYFLIPIMLFERKNLSNSVFRLFIMQNVSIYFYPIIVCLYLFLMYVIKTPVAIIYSFNGIIIDILQVFCTPLILGIIMVFYMEDIQISYKYFENEFQKKAIALLLILFFLPSFINIVPNNVFSDNIIVIGHRGGLNGVENSLNAVSECVKQGADYAEIDVILSNDGVPVVIHDNALYRLSGEMTSVHELNINQLENIILKQNGSEDNICTLDKLLKSVKNTKFLIHLKTHGYENANLVEKVIDVVNLNQADKHCIYQTSKYDIINYMKLKYPDKRVGFVVSSNLGDISSSINDYNLADFFSVEYAVLTQRLVNSCHQVNKPVYVWTINDYNKIIEFEGVSVDGIITDYPNIFKNRRWII